MDPSPDAPVKRRKTSHSTGDSVDKPVKEKKDKKEKKEKKDRKDRKEKKAKKAVQPSDVPKEPAKPAATDSASEAEEPAQDDLATIETEDVPAIEKAVVAGSPIQKPEAAVEPVVQKTFADLGVMDSLCETCATLGYKAPTPIQAESIPVALEGKDLIGLAETGSGKTAAFALPILQALWNKPAPYFACVLAPTRELAFQIAEQFEALGSGIGVRCAVIVGGMNMMEQAVALGKKPHIIIASPGRLLDHLENTKGFSLRSLKYLVMDEADRLLDLDFGPIIDKVLKAIPKERNTYLFSATMTSKVEKLQRASLQSPARVSVSSKYSTVSTLIQLFLFIPFMHKDTYLVYLLNSFSGQTMLIFARTVAETNRLALLLRNLGMKAIPLNGQMSQSSRLGSLNKFKSGARNILVATDVAARGLDIPSVDAVINFDLAQDSKTYIHRVGRTARAGRSGRSISIVTQYDVELFLRIEAALGKKIPQMEVTEEDVLILSETVGEAQREAIRQLKEEKEKRGNGRQGRSGGAGGKGKRRRDDMDVEEQ